MRLNLHGASAVNRNGYVVGQVYAGTYRSTFGDILPYFRVSLWHDAGLTDLGTLVGRRSWAIDVNGSQVVVGAAEGSLAQRCDFKVHQSDRLPIGERRATGPQGRHARF